MHKFGGKHTDEKLDKLSEYIEVYTTALKKRKFQLLYIDACAGTGDRTTVLNLGPIFGNKNQIITTPGSARIALENEPSFDVHVFIERNKERYCQLKVVEQQYPHKKCKLCEGDANDFVSRLCTKIPWHEPTNSRIGMRGVIFLDPFGMEINWKTIECIGNTKALDAWIFFPLSGLYRNAPHDKLNLSESKIDSVTRVLGTDSWLDDWYSNSSSGEEDLFGNIEPSKQIRTLDVTGIEQYVRKRLKTVFKGAVLKPMRIKNEQGAPIASLFFCVANETPKAIGAATRIANHILKSGM